MPLPPAPQDHLAAKQRWRPIEAAFWLATLLPFVLVPTYLTLASQIAITAIVAVSLDLILGYAGLVSLGHAAYFGLGAYTAGLISKAGWGEPFSGLLIAAAVTGLFGYLTGFIIVRVRRLALIMITLGIGLLLYEVANREDWLTGGNDGLQGVSPWPLFGRFDFDLYGYTAYAYALAVLFLVVLAARRLVHSPFGLTLRAIRENERRMPAIGTPSQTRLHTVHTIAAALAGLAGGLLAQTTQFVSLGALSFDRSAELIVILVIGGTGRLYGGIVGAIVYMVARDRLSGMNPQYWYFWIGMMLICVVLFLPNGVLGGLAKLAALARGGRVVPPPSEPPAALRTSGLCKSFGSLAVARDVAINLPAGARHALIGPNGAGKTTLINLITGVLRPDAGRILLGDADVTDLEPHRRVRRGLARTFQINTLFPDLEPLEAVTLAVCERLGVAGAWWRGLGGISHAIDEAFAILSSLGLGAVYARPTRELAYGQQRLLEIALALATRPKVLLLDEPAAGVPRQDGGALFEVIANLPADIAVLFIEHDMDVVFRFASRVIVMVGGRLLVEGTPAEIAANAQVREVYLGRAHHG